jgi:opacity protein-like surface antigen
LLKARLLLLSCLPVLLAASSIAAQKEVPPQIPLYGRTNSFGFLFAYSNDSSHMILGTSEQRKLLHIGADYSRKLILNRYLNWQYDAEILPVALESDPLPKVVVNETSPTVQTIVYTNGPPPIACGPYTYTYSYTDQNGVKNAGTVTESCSGRQWTIGEAMSPVGMRWNFRPTHPIQPFLEGHGGYMYTTQAIPTEGAGSFNFTFDIGAGIEWYRTPTHSMRFEWRYHHISDHDTTDINPGIDNGLFQVTYVFGR